MILSGWQQRLGSRVGGAGLLLVLLVFAAPALPQSTPEAARGFTAPREHAGTRVDPPPLEGRRSDPAVTDRLLTEEGLDRGRPRPGFQLWLRDVGVAVSDALATWLGGVVGTPAPWMVEGLFWTLVVILPLVLLAFVLVGLWRRRRGRRRAEDREPPVAEEIPLPRGSDAWRRLLEEHLAAGRVAAALEALWWWLAASLAGEDADPAWTGRELLRATGRRDLRQPVRDLEIFAYGGRPVAIADVESLWTRLRTTASGRAPGAASGDAEDAER